MQVAHKQKHAYRENIRVIVNAIVMSLVFNLEGGKEWVSGSKRHLFPSWQDVVQCSRLENIFHVYLKRKGSNFLAVAVLLRWFLAFELRALHQFVCAADRVDSVLECSVDWVKSFGGDMRQVFKYVEQELSHAQGTTISVNARAEVGVHKQKKTHNILNLPSDVKQRRAVV